MNVWDKRWREHARLQMRFNTLVIEQPSAQHCLVRWHVYLAKAAAKAEAKAATNGQWVKNNPWDVAEAMLPPGLLFRFAE